MRTRLIFILLSGITLLMGGCYKDKGNYDYNAINAIGISGLNPAYSCVYGKTLSIKPTLTLSNDSTINTYDTTKYKYEWNAINAGAVYASSKFVLATTRDFNAVISAPPATYTVYYRVTEKATGIQWQATFTLTVTTSVYEGWLVLCNVNDSSRLDMVTYIDSMYYVVPNVLDSVQSGLPPQGKPYSVSYSPYSATTTGIYICTATGTNRVDQNYFKWNSLLNIKTEVFANVPDNFTASFIQYQPSQSQYMLAMGNIYYYYYTYNLYFGTPVNQMSGETGTFTPAPFIATPSLNNYPAIMYDAGRQRFVRHAPGAYVCTPLTSDSSLFSYTTGKKLVHMQYSPYNGGEVFSVLKDEATGKYYLARFTLGASIKQTYYAEITATDFDKAENFTVNPDYGYLFYNVGSKVYEYDMGLKQSIFMLDKGSSKISFLKFHRFVGSKYTSKLVYYNKLIVGSYDPALPEGKNGTMELFNVPQVNGPLSVYQTYTGFGKIVSVSYRER